MGLLEALKQYASDAVGGSLNPEVGNTLSGLLNYGKDRAKYIGGLLDDSSPINKDFKNWHDRTQLGLADLIAGKEGPQADYGYSQIMNMAGVAPLGITAWHGSPHKFDKFSLDKIGTGEGAQAYGHGLYLAESPNVASSYVQSVVANSDELAKRGAAYGLPGDVASNLISAKQSGKHFDDVLEAAKKAADYPLISPSQKAAAQRLVDNEMQAYNAWSDWSKPGSLYKVDLPDEHIARMLDWDKPLSQQAPEVQAALGEYRDTDKAKIINLIRIGEQPNGFGVVKSGSGYAPVVNGEVVGNGAKDLVFGSHDEAINYIAKQIPETDPTGASIYRRMVGERGGADGISQAQVSNLLHQQGIPGIRYLDGGSRSAGQGSSNFVAFDPEMIRILERNGQPTGLEPWKPGEYRLGDLLK